jgi:hypothetical protein
LIPDVRKYVSRNFELLFLLARILSFWIYCTGGFITKAGHQEFHLAKGVKVVLIGTVLALSFMTAIRKIMYSSYAKSRATETALQVQGITLKTSL